MDRRITLGLLFAIILAHVVIAAGFAVETPYRSPGILLSYPSSNGGPNFVKDIGAPDERQHVNYVQHLMDGLGFPVFNPTDPNLYETYQSHQPPAFYVLATGWSKLMGASDLSSQDSGIKIRSLNVVIGSITIAGVFFLVFWGFASEGIALVATAFAALLPMFAALSGAVSNDPLLFCLCTWVLALLTLAAKNGWSWKLAIGIGVLTGIALLTKTTALALLPIILLALVFKGAKRPSPAMVCASAVVALVIVGPWWVRNQNLYHDPLAMQAFTNAFKGSAQKEGILAVIQSSQPDANPEITYWKDWVGWWTSRSFFGVFGYMDLWLNERGTSSTSPNSPNALYRLLLAATFLCAVGWLVSLKAADSKQRVLANTLNGAFFLVVLILFLRFNNQYFQAQARYLLPAIGPIAGAFAVGLAELTKRRTYVALGAVLLIFGGIDGYALSRLPAEFSRRTGEPMTHASRIFEPATSRFTRKLSRDT
jgi:4-amino-4-deoxy-L-arabinose transferase-like glycosyltransferase